MFKRLIAVILVVVIAGLMAVPALAQDASANLNDPFGSNLLVAGCDTITADPVVWGMMASMSPAVAEQCGVPPSS